MDAPRPSNLRPQFRAPGSVDDPPPPAAGRAGAAGRHPDREARCELPGCDTPVPEHPGNEGRSRYCCPRHRSEARARRRQARYDLA
ncbi:hypothetical protein GCM10023320_49790 [Pseudonocardia adelaidensis]|uniref:GcrA cell cycle regulator n=1 Tax=Pseudonocardia adelaidensis TaxID=648754 RepID=A0ABP9NR08_9PSEU